MSDKLFDYKYRICISNSSGLKAVFCCEYDQLHLPKKTFIGKPIYLQGINKNGLSFPQETILGDHYTNISRTSPQSIYLTDIGLKLLCQQKCPDLVLNNSSTVFQTYCEVPTNTIIETVSSLDIFKKVIESKTCKSQILTSLMDIFPRDTLFRIIGKHSFNPLHEGNELDLTLYSKNLNELKTNFKIFKKLSDIKSSYINNLWPLTIRSKVYGTIDFFFHLVELPDHPYKNISCAKIINENYEFYLTVIDDDLSILPLPCWILSKNKLLLSTDTALKGRIKKGDTVTGVGILCVSPDNNEMIIVPTDRNISKCT